jgi:endonuclease/exonuclease/phosphatase family metal-dependent hydrolase
VCSILDHANRYDAAMLDRRDRWRIATLNIWNRQGPWPERVALIREQLLALDVDALALQEVLAFAGLPTQADEIISGLGWNAYYAPAMTIGGGLTFGNAIVSPHALLDTAAFPLPTPPNLEARSVAFARVDAPHGPIPLFCTHLSWELHVGAARCAQVRALADLVAGRVPLGSGPPPILCGDFNAEPDSDEMRFLRGLTGLGGNTVFFADCYEATRDRAGNDAPGFTFDRRNRYAANAHEPPRRIDYIYSRGPDRSLRGEPMTCELAFTEPRGDIWPSDHFGVIAELYAAPRAIAP